jgi:predicted enzyme related to lactoylglutathione lyase
MTTFSSCRLNLEVTELAPTVAFLRDVLGFTVEMEVEEVEYALAMLNRDEVGVAVVRAERPGVNETTACYVTVTEVDDLHAYCLGQGANIVAPPTDHPWGLRDFVVEIPGGHKLALGQRLG